VKFIKTTENELDHRLVCDQGDNMSVLFKPTTNLKQVTHTYLKGALLIASLMLSLGTTGCIVDDGSVENQGQGSQNFPPPDFEVPPESTELPQVPNPDPGVVSPEEPEIGLELLTPSLTKNTTARLKIYPGWRTYMRIGYHSTCNNGPWVPVQTEIDFQLLQANGRNDITAQYADMEFGDRTDCLKLSVIHDSKNPVINLPKYPAPTIVEGGQPELQYVVSDENGIQSTVCTLNGINKPCASGGPHDVNLTQLPVGNYSFSISATDNAGNSSSETVSWEVKSRTRNFTQTFQLNEYRKVDILMVIDNSGSMDYEQKSMASRVRNFISILKGLDWQIAVTTTDPTLKQRSGHYTDGQLIPMPGSNNYILSSAMDETEAQNLLGQTLQRSEAGSGSEQGINATYRVIERSKTPGTPQSALFRPGAQFASLVISDEDESATTAKNDPHNLVNLVAETFGGQKNFSYHSIITKPGDTACRSTHGAAYGERYKIMSDLTGGIIGSVCESDYAAQLTGIASRIRDLLKTLTLQCEPVAGYPIVVELNGQVYTAPYVVEGLNLRFNTEFPPGTVTVNYNCL
jgi:hypothetical protein